MFGRERNEITDIINVQRADLFCAALSNPCSRLERGENDRRKRRSLTINLTPFGHSARVTQTILYDTSFGLMLRHRVQREGKSFRFN